jgi:hypothetical protein
MHQRGVSTKPIKIPCMTGRRESYRVILPVLAKSPAAGRQKKFFEGFWKNTKYIFCIFRKTFLGIFRNHSEIFENT